MSRDDDAPTETAFGAYIRSQRRLARLTLRELSALADISNPYLSQIERGLHQPSVKVIKSLAHALNLSAEALLAQAAGIEGEPAESDVEEALRADPRLSDEQKLALLTIYRDFVRGARATDQDLTV